jgi:HAD superfamily hydrolase (TIGR01450 family)
MLIGDDQVMRGSPRSLATEYDVALLDLDGVVYLGEEAIPGAPAGLAAAREQGMRLAFVTNNASRTPDQVAALLVRLNVPARPSDVITSSHAAAHYLADRLPAGAPVLVLGTTGLINALQERGLTPVYSADDSPAAVVQGYSPDLDWHALAEGMVAIRRGAQWIATNLDPTVPSSRGPLPGNGALVAALRHASGVTPVSTGKPDPTMHAESVQRSEARHPLVVGDRLDTDIEGARRAGADSLLVLTGVTDPAALLAALPLCRPDFLAPDAGGLLVAHPPVAAEGSGFRCGAWSVQAAEAEGVLVLRVDGSRGSAEAGDGLDGLRVLCVAHWARHPEDGAPAQVIAAGDAAEEALRRWGLTQED